MNGTNKTNATVAVKDVYDAFRVDKHNAEQEYLHKTKQVKGFVTYAGPDIYGLPSIELSEQQVGETRIICVLHFSDYLKLRKVSKKQEITITGEIVGLYDGNKIVMKNCQIV